MCTDWILIPILIVKICIKVYEIISVCLFLCTDARVSVAFVLIKHSQQVNQVQLQLLSNYSQNVALFVSCLRAFPCKAFLFVVKIKSVHS